MKQLVPNFILEKYNKHQYSGSLQAFVLFIDISGFTAMTQDLMKTSKEGAEILSDIINNVFSPAIQHIYNNLGFVSTFAGDAFTAIFPHANLHSVLNAATDIKQEFVSHGEHDTKFGTYSLYVKTGISFGFVEWEIIKNPTHCSYYFRGAAIDRAALNEQQADKNEIITDRTVLTEISNSQCAFSVYQKHFFRIDSFQAYPTQIVTQSVPESILDFSHDFLQQTSAKSEFRHIVSCFISFRETEHLSEDLSQVITLANQYGGFFNKIDFGDKGGIALILFGAPKGLEKIYEKATDFAFAINKLPSFSCRIGLTSGIAYTGFIGSSIRTEYTALGMVVNLSARIMMRADWNSILIDSNMAKNVSDKYEIKSLGKMKLKGFSQSVKIHQLEQKKSFEQNFLGTMIGREKEQQQIYDFLVPLKNNRFCGIFYIHGPAGIGKSRLSAEVKRNLNNYLWLFLPCDEIIQKSFHPIHHMLKQLFRQSEDSTENTNKNQFLAIYQDIVDQVPNEEIKLELIRTKSVIGALLNLFWPNSLWENLDPQTRYENIIYSLKNLIKALSFQQPVVLEVEDAHWLDNDSRSWIELLTNNIHNYPIAIVANARLLPDGTTFHFRKTDFATEEIQLHQFTFDKVSSLVQKRLEENNFNTDSIPHNLLNLIWEKSNGNPFYIEQIIMYLIENNFIDEHVQLTQNSIAVPTQINSIIIARIDRLSYELQEAIRTASVLGKEFLSTILIKMLTLISSNQTSSEEIIKQGEIENIWHPAHELFYIFKHALVRESVYEIQLKKRLRELHKLAADTILNIYQNQLEPHYEELAYHYFRAEQFCESQEFYGKAGIISKQQFLNGKALSLFQKRYEIFTTYLHSHIDKKNDLLLNDYVDTLFELKYLYQTIGNLSEAEKIVQTLEAICKEMNDPICIAKTSLDYANLLKLKNQNQKALTYLSEAKEIFLNENKYLLLGLCYLDLGIVHFRLGDQQKAFDYFQQELATFKKIGDTKRIAEAYGNLGVIYRYIGQLDKAMDFFNKQIDIAQEIEDKIQIARAQSNIGWVFEAKQNYSEAIHYYQQSLSINKELGLNMEIVRIMDNLGFVYQLNREYQISIEHHNKAMELAIEINDPESIANININLGSVYNKKDSFEKAISYYYTAKEITKKHRLHFFDAEISIGLGFSYLELGQLDQAKEWLLSGKELALEQNDHNLVEEAEKYLTNLKERS